jgi:hypothetical protein
MATLALDYQTARRACSAIPSLDAAPNNRPNSPLECTLDRTVAGGVLRRMLGRQEVGSLTDSILLLQLTSVDIRNSAAST